MVCPVHVIVNPVYIVSLSDGGSMTYIPMKNLLIAHFTFLLCEVAWVFIFDLSVLAASRYVIGSTFMVACVLFNSRKELITD